MYFRRTWSNINITQTARQRNIYRLEIENFAFFKKRDQFKFIVNIMLFFNEIVTKGQVAITDKIYPLEKISFFHVKCSRRVSESEF